MDKNIILELDDFQVELEGAVKNLMVGQMFVSDQEKNGCISDGLFGACRHFERLNEELKTIVSKAFKAT